MDDEAEDACIGSEEAESLGVIDSIEGTKISVVKLDTDFLQENVPGGVNQDPEFTATFQDGGDVPQFQVIFENVAPVVKEEAVNPGVEDVHTAEYTEWYPVVQESHNASAFCSIEQKSAEFRRNVGEHMYTMQKDGLLCDIQIDVNGSEIPVNLHSVVLAGACPKFRDELQGCVDESENSVKSVAVLGSLTLNLMNQLIRFLYTGEIELSECEDVNKLHECSQLLHIEELQHIIEVFLHPELHPDPQESLWTSTEPDTNIVKEQPVAKRPGRPKKERRSKVASQGGSPLQKDNVDSTTSLEKVMRGVEVEEGEESTGKAHFPDDMIVSSTDDNKLSMKASDSGDEEKVSSTKHGKGKGRKKQEVGVSSAATPTAKTPETGKKPRGRPKKESIQPKMTSFTVKSDNLDSSIDETKSAKKKKVHKKKDTSLVETAGQDTSLTDGDAAFEEELREDTTAGSSSRRTIKRPSWFNKDFITAKSMDKIEKIQEVKKAKLSFEDEDHMMSSPMHRSPLRLDKAKLTKSPGSKSQMVKTPAKPFSVETSEFLKGLSSGRPKKDKVPVGASSTPGTSTHKRESFVPISGKKPKTIFTGFGRKRKHSMDIEYIIVNKFRSHNWKYYKSYIAERPTVQVYDLSTHPVLNEALKGSPIKIKGDVSRLITLPSKRPKKKPRSRKVRKIKSEINPEGSEKAAPNVKAEKSIDKPTPRGRPKKSAANKKAEVVKSEEEKSEAEDKTEANDESEAAVSTETESVDTEPGAVETPEESEPASEELEEEEEDSDPEIIITQPVKRKRGRPRALNKASSSATTVAKKSLWKPKKPTFASQFRKTGKSQIEKLREIRHSSKDALEVGLHLILEMNYSMPRAAHAANVEWRELRSYVTQKQREGALKRVVVRPRGNTGQQFYCMCGQTFKSINAINLHVDKYDCKFGMEVFKKCGKCKLPYWDDESYLDHFDKEHPTSRVLLKCNYCPNYEVRTCKLIQLHMKLYHGISLTEFGKQIVYKCKFQNCDYESFYEICQQLHHREHSVSAFRCFKCNKLCKSYSLLQEHKNTHRDTTVSKCNLCEKEFQEIPDFKEHMLVYHDDALVPGYTKVKTSYFEEDNPDNTEEVYLCEICQDFSTNSRNKLAAHKVAVHPKGNRDTICPAEKVPYVAEVTPKARRMVGPMLNLAPFECDICEGFHGNAAVDLAVHKFREHGEDFDAKKYQLFACSHCQFKTTNQSVYQSHLDSHVGLNHKCRSCIRYFCTYEDMEEHAVIHQRGRKVRCDYINCDFTCSIEGNLKKHLARHQTQGGGVVQEESLAEGDVDIQMAMAVLGESSLLPAKQKPRQTQPIRKHISPKKRFSHVKRHGGGVQVSLLREKARALVAEAKQRSPVKARAFSGNNPWQTISVLTDPEETTALDANYVQTPAASEGITISFMDLNADTGVAEQVPTGTTSAGADGFIIKNIMDLNQDIADLGGSVISVEDGNSNGALHMNGILGNDGEIIQTEAIDGLSSSFVIQGSTPAQSEGVVLESSMGDILGGGTGGILTLTPEQLAKLTITPLDYTLNEHGELVAVSQGE